MVKQVGWSDISLICTVSFANKWIKKDTIDFGASTLGLES